MPEKKPTANPVQTATEAIYTAMDHATKDLSRDGYRSVLEAVESHCQAAQEALDEDEAEDEI